MEELIQILGVAALIVWQIYSRAQEQKEKQAALEADPSWDDDDWQEPDDDELIVFPDHDEPVGEQDWDELWAGDGADDAEDAAVAFVDPYAEERRELLAKIDALTTEADEFLRSARLERATQRIAEVLSDFVLPRARALRERVSDVQSSITAGHYDELSELGLVFGAVEAFVGQRRVPGVREALGDADAFARACYEPIFDFARVNRLDLTSAEPVAALTGFDLGIWTQFIPTGIAPIFLPSTFFSDVRWWPAIAHEIGHDFLAATGRAEQELRDQLGLPSEDVGTRPLAFYGGELPVSEFVRVFGGWFEEIFCDVFGTMMMGPAYGYTMIELFAMPDAPHLTAMVSVDDTGRRYQVHPPRALRVRLVSLVLGLIEEHEAADEVLGEWTEIHGAQDEILFPIAGGGIEVSMRAMMHIAGSIARTLHGEGLHGFDGHSLSAIPGLEYGPHRAAEARRAAEAMLAGRVPREQRARAVVAGAVLAWRQDRTQHAQIIALARRAIVGVTETREDAYSQPADFARPLITDGIDPREAFLLHVLLSPPPSSGRSDGFLARRTWPPRR